MEKKTYIVKGDSLYGEIKLEKPKEYDEWLKDKDNAHKFLRTVYDACAKYHFNLSRLPLYCRQSGLKEGSLVVQNVDFRLQKDYYKCPICRHTWPNPMSHNCQDGEFVHFNTVKWEHHPTVAVSLAIPAASVSAAQSGEPEWYKRIQQLKGLAKNAMHEWLLSKGWKWNDYEETYSDGKPFGKSMNKTEAWSYFLDENKLGWDDDQHLLAATAPVMQQGEGKAKISIADIIHKGVEFAKERKTESESYNMGLGYGYSCGYEAAIKDHVLPTPASNQNEQEEGAKGKVFVYSHPDCPFVYCDSPDKECEKAESCHYLKSFKRNT